MLTRKLNELHVNRAIDSVNSNTLELLTIEKNKKGVHMISYESSTSTNADTIKNSTSIELVRVLKEIQRQVCNHGYKSIKLDYARKESKLIYQLELKEQG